MLRGDAKQKLLARLRRAEGQVAAVSRMVEEDADCVDVLLQIAAIRGALGKAGQVLLESHLRECVIDAFESGDAGDRDRKLEELVEVFGRYGGMGARR